MKLGVNVPWDSRVLCTYRVLFVCMRVFSVCCCCVCVRACVCVVVLWVGCACVRACACVCVCFTTVRFTEQKETLCEVQGG